MMKHGVLTSIDDLLEKELGWQGFGPGQWLTLLVCGLSYVNSSLIMFVMAFTYTDPLAGSGPPGWRCVDPKDIACAAVARQYTHHGDDPTSVGLNETEAEGFILGRNDGGDYRADQPRSFCDLKQSQYEWIHPETSLNSEYNLVCAKKWKASVLETLFFAGFMAGNGVFGIVADRHGRRMTLMTCGAATAALTALSASPLIPRGPGSRVAAAAAVTAQIRGSGGDDDAGGSGAAFGFWAHLVLRCAAGLTCAGQSLGSYVLATEEVGPRWRGAAGMLIQTFYILGEFLLVGLSLAFPPWRQLTLAVAAFCLAALMMVALVPESPRWLLLHGRPGKARAALMWIARLNGLRSPPELSCTPDGEIYLLPPGRPDKGSQSHRRTEEVHRDDDSSDGANAAADEPLISVLASAVAAAAVEDALLAASDSDADGDGDERETAPLMARQQPASSFALRPPAFGPVTTADATAISGPDDATATGAGPSATDAAVAASAVSLLTALAHPVTRRLLLSACFAMFALSVAYFGVTLALGSLVAGSLHLNFLLTAAAELPGYLAIAATTDRLGRRLVIGGGTAMAGLACLACAFTAGGPLQVVLAMVGKLGCSGAWAVGLTFVSELFPTSLRSAALSIASQSGDLGGLVTPPLLLLSPPGPLERLPFAIMGLMSLAAVALVWRLPETRGMPQLDTFGELLDWLQCNSCHTQSEAYGIGLYETGNPGASVAAGERRRSVDLELGPLATATRVGTASLPLWRGQ